jgi:hypothetical protein
MLCGLFAQNETQIINKEEVKTVVQEYFRTVTEEVEKTTLSVHPGKNAREAYEDYLSKWAIVSPWDLQQEFHVVKAKRHNGCTQALFLLPMEQKQGYLPMWLSIREVEGHLKVVLEQTEEPKDEGLDAVSSSITRFQKSLQEWKSAQGAALIEKISILKERLLDEIDALEYAMTKNLQVFPGYGDLAPRRDLYNDIRRLPNEDVRTKMVEEIGSELEALSR